MPHCHNFHWHTAAESHVMSCHVMSHLTMTLTCCSCLGFTTILYLLLCICLQALPIVGSSGSGSHGWVLHGHDHVLAGDLATIIHSPTENCSDTSSQAQAISYNPKDVLTRSFDLLVGQPISKDIDRSNFDRMEQLLHSMWTDASATINVLVLGGSLTAGRHVGGIMHAWPQLLERTLARDDSLIKATVNVTNAAVPATTLGYALAHFDSMLSSPQDAQYDLIIVDYDVNDCVLLQPGINNSTIDLLATTQAFVERALNLASRPALLFLNVAVSHNGKKNHGLDNTLDMHQTCYIIGELRLPLLTQYSIPLLSQKSAIWPAFNCPPASKYWPCATFCSHPGADAHRLLADIVSGFLVGDVFPNYVSSALPVGSSGIPNHDHSTSVVTMHPFGDFYQNLLRSMQPENQRTTDSKYSYSNYLYISYSRLLISAVARRVQSIRQHMCLRPHMTLPNATMPSSSTTTTATILAVNDSLKRKHSSSNETHSNNANSSCRDWEFIEDVRGKPGWIGSCFGNALYLPVTLGPQAILTLSYLRSYTPDFGLAEVSLGLHSFNVTTFTVLGIIDGIAGHPNGDWKHSLTSDFVFYSTDDGPAETMETAAVARAVMVPNSSYVLRITLLDGNDAKLIKSTAFHSGVHHDRSAQQRFKLISVLTC